MGELAKQNHCQALLVTGDKDALQLVGGPVKVLYTKRGISDTDLMDAEAVKQKMGVYPELVADLKGLTVSYTHLDVYKRQVSDDPRPDERAGGS